MRLAIVTKLRSRGDKAGFSHTSPNRTVSVISARCGAISPKPFRAFVGVSTMAGIPCFRAATAGIIERRRTNGDPRGAFLASATVVLVADLLHPIDILAV